MSLAYMEQPSGRFNDVAGDGVHIPAAMSAYATGIALVVCQNRLHALYCDRSPVFFDERTHTCKPGDRIWQRVGFVISELGRQIMVGMKATVWMLILEEGDAFGTHLYIGDSAIAIAQQHVGRRACPVLRQQFNTFVNSLLLQHDAFEWIMRKTRLPITIIQGIGKMCQTVLIHTRVADLSCEGEDKRSRPSIIGLYPQQNGYVCIFWFQVLVLTG